LPRLGKPALATTQTDRFLAPRFAGFFVTLFLHFSHLRCRSFVILKRFLQLEQILIFRFNAQSAHWPPALAIAFFLPHSNQTTAMR